MTLLLEKFLGFIHRPVSRNGLAYCLTLLQPFVREMQDITQTLIQRGYSGRELNREMILALAAILQRHGYDQISPSLFLALYNEVRRTYPKLGLAITNRQTMKEGFRELQLRGLFQRTKNKWRTSQGGRSPIYHVSPAGFRHVFTFLPHLDQLLSEAAFPNENPVKRFLGKELHGIYGFIMTMESADTGADIFKFPFALPFNDST